MSLIPRTVFAVALTAGLSSTAWADMPSNMTFGAIRKNTPSCKGAPAGSFAGHVSGSFGSGNSNKFVGFEGCFPTREACDRWRNRVSGQITGRLILNNCRQR